MLIDRLCDEYELALRAGRGPRLEDCLAEAPAGHRDELLVELLRIEIDLLRETHAPGPAILCDRHPALAGMIEQLWGEAERVDGTVRHVEHRFRIIAPIGRGGEGVIFLARDEELGRTVVIKELLPARPDAGRAVERFENEARVTGLLEHPGILPVFAMGWRDDRRPFFVTRHVPGPTLDEVLAEFHARHAGCRRVEWTIALRALLRRYLEVCDVVRHAHSRGVVHRDLKPANLLVGRHGETVVIDWGLARVLDDRQFEGTLDAVSGDPPEPAAPGITVAGDMLGTPGYASPEQYDPHARGTGVATDVYGLGATLYQLLTGRRPFHELLGHRDEVTPSRLARLADTVRTSGPPSPRATEPRVPKPLDAVCRHAMQADPAARYPSVEALANDVAAWLDGAPMSVAPDRPWHRAWRWVRDHRLAAGALAATLLIGALAWLWGIYLRAQAATKVASWVQGLRIAGIGDVPGLTSLLAGERELAREALAAELGRPALPDGEYWNLAIAAAAIDPDQARRLADRLQDEPALARTLTRQLLQLGAEDAGRFGALRDQLQVLRRPLVLPLLDGLRFGGQLDTTPVEAERERIAETLLRYAGDAPALLAEASLHVPTASFPRYARRLEASPSEARAALVGIAPFVEPAWPPRPDVRGLPGVGPAFAAEVLASGGIVADDFALATSVPVERLVGLTEGLRGSGYRPIRVRPVAGTSAPLFSVVWARDELPWELYLDDDPRVLRDRDESNRARQWLAVDAAGFVRPGRSTPTFVGVWVARPDRATRRASGVERTDASHYWASWPIAHDDDPETRMLVGVDPATAETFARTLPKYRWHARTSHVLATSGGTVVCETWDDVDRWGPIVALSDGDERALADHFAHHEATGSITTDLGLWQVVDEAGRVSTHYRTTSLSPKGFFQPLLEAGLAPAALRERAVTLRAAGYRPLALVASTTRGVVVTTSLWHRPAYRAHVATEWELRARGRRVALLARLGDDGPLRDSLRAREDPTLRMYLIDHAADLGLPPERLARLATDSADSTIRRSAILAISSLPLDDRLGTLIESLRPQLESLETATHDAGLRAAAQRLLRPREGIGEPVASTAREVPPTGKHSWFTTREGETFSVVRGPVEFSMGLVYGLDVDPMRDAQHRRSIGRSFAIASTEVTDAQFRAYLQAVLPHDPRLGRTSPYGEPRTGPALGVSWLDAARYCNWRSRLEGLVPCFDEQPGGEITVPADCLQRSGYRLPTEAEWEFACRAGSRVAYVFGRSRDPGMEEAVSGWAWWQGNAENRARSVGTRRPNDLGLFDMLGNAHEWCLDTLSRHCRGECHVARDDAVVPGPVAPRSDRVLRGSWFDENYPGCASGHRSWNHAEDRSSENGFRLARTIDASSVVSGDDAAIPDRPASTLSAHGSTTCSDGSSQ